jgi:nucleoside 2-deoxyribosyltransferase
MKRIYLAGPTVFFRHAEQAFAALEALCHARGLVPVRPATPVNAQGELLSGAAASRHLFAENTRRIHEADGVLADLRPFRGELEPDSGTVFEVGYAHALGKPVAGLLPTMTDWGQRVRQACGVGHPNDQGLAMDARHDMLIEDFGGALNLMLAESCHLTDSVSAALDWLAAQPPGARA